MARLLVLGEISLMMDGTLIPLDKVYEPITHAGQPPQDHPSSSGTPPTPRRSRTPAISGKELFAEMGPDGEDGLFTFLQGKLKDWQANLNDYKPLADTGNYPGKEEIADGLTLINKLLADKDSFKFIERFNTAAKMT